MRGASPVAGKIRLRALAVVCAARGRTRASSGPVASGAGNFPRRCAPRRPLKLYVGHMNKVLAGLVLGCLVTAVLVWAVVLPQVRESYRAVGFNDGTIAARSEIAGKIPAALGSDLSKAERQQVLYSVKTTTVVIVERNGVKTLRVIE